MECPKLFRKRFIPDEMVLLKDDKIVFADDEIIVTKWNVLRKRSDFTHGASCYFLNKNIKVSKFIDRNENILYWYCDIIDWKYDKEDNAYIFYDLLIDIIVYENGFVKVVDMSEISDALDKGIIDIELVKKALRAADELLNIIYQNKFDTLKKYIEGVV